MNFAKLIKLTYDLNNTQNLYHRCKHFSFILYKNKVVSIGINNPRKTHPKNLKNKYKNRTNEDISCCVGIHSELSAVIKYGYEDCSNHILVNTRVNALGELSNSRPCCGCQNLIKQLKFKKVYYTNKQGQFETL
jgi:deoxycytidylate deaminase